MTKRRKAQIPGWLPRNLFEFQWELDPKGYAIDWQKRAPRSAAATVLAADQRVIYPRSSEQKGIRPLHGGVNLAAALAAVGDADSSILEFVHTYGPLQDGSQRVSDFKKARNDVRHVLQMMEHYRGRPRSYGAADLVYRFIEKRGIDALLRLRPRTVARKQVFEPEPCSLLSAIWCLLHAELSGALQWKVCKYPKCGRAYPAGVAGLRRDDSLFCSDKCTKAADNARRAAALRKESASRRAQRKLLPSARRCVYCGEDFRPKRKDTPHCGKAACRQAHSRGGRKRKERAATKGRNPRNLSKGGRS